MLRFSLIIQPFSEDCHYFGRLTGKRLTLRHFEKEIDKWAGLLNIQKLQSIKPSGKEYRLVTLMALREAGERNKVMKLLDMKGYDPTLIEDPAPFTVEISRRWRWERL